MSWTGQLLLSLSSGLQADVDVAPADHKLNSGEEGVWWPAVESLRLDSCQLRRIDGICKLTQLQSASFADNQLTSFQGVRTLTTLTSLQYQVCLQASKQLLCVQLYSNIYRWTSLSPTRDTTRCLAESAGKCLAGLST